MRKRLRECKKPKGLLNGDIWPELLMEVVDEVAPPLTNIINEALNTCRWPKIWKTEVVTVIPKNKSPSTLGETRNISCTPLFSKILEHFVLLRVRSEVVIRNNQYGSTAGVGTNHYLAQAWTDILEKLDQENSSCCLVSVDFAKAFNTMCHGACLKALRAAGGSPHSIAMTAAFLTDRKMEFKVGNTLSSARHLKGGAPQGTLMGNFLFILTTDNIDADDPIITDPMPVQRPIMSPLARPNPHRCQSPLRSGVVPVDASTPVRGMIPDLEDSFSYVNAHRQPYNRLEDSIDQDAASLTLNGIEMDALNPPGSAWKKVDQTDLKYVDDIMAIEHLPITSGYNVFSTSRTKLFIHAYQSESFFNRVKSAAENIGMRVNDNKTQMLCLAGNNLKDINTYMHLPDGSRIEGQDTLKQLGFIFGRLSLIHI